MKGVKNKKLKDKLKDEPELIEILESLRLVKLENIYRDLGPVLIDANRKKKLKDIII